MWINAIENKPSPSKENENISDKVLIWIEGDTEPYFALYYYGADYWIILSRTLQVDHKKAKYFMYIDNPYILNF